MSPASLPSGPPRLEADPRWYKDAIIYEVHVRAFADSDGDGAGDFRGLTGKLDYLADLGVTAIWLLPFYPSPLRDDGYDIADYTSVHPDYGTLRDVRQFIREAHRRGLRVITELVCNHTSDQHPWFQRARRAPRGSAARDFYVWSDTPDRYPDARIIFKDTEHSNWAWDPVAGQYYWHRFFSHQPDLNFENPKVQAAVFRAMEFWLDMGVDGLRLDAVPYLFEREGTNCENLPETHEFLRRLRARIDARYGDRMLLAEANQWPEDSVPYFGDGDECHMAFHFPVMPRMFMAIRMEDRFPIADILGQTPPIPETAQWALFLRNHDELTLEMVTDEERDYMYRVYANDPQMRINLGIRRRLAPLLNNNRRRIELMNGLLFSLPGTPVLYYGDEIGMGDNVYLGDRNGVRTPMQWSGDRNAGFSDANRQALYFPVITDPEYHYEAINVAVQQANPQSLLWWMKRLIALRRQHPAFGRGSLEFLHPDNRKVLAFIRRSESDDEQILVVANLSRFTQPAELDLSAFQGMTPVEMFGRVDFPAIGALPYFLTIAPHGFYWFRLRAPAAAAVAAAERALPAIRVDGEWQDAVRGRAAGRFTALLPEWLRDRRWFRSKAREIRVTRLRDTIEIAMGGRELLVCLLDVEYVDGDPETYILPLAFAVGEEAEGRVRDQPAAVVARLELPEGRPLGVLYDALADGRMAGSLLDAIEARRRFRGAHGELAATPTRRFGHLRGPAGTTLPAAATRTEQSNSSVVLGDRLILKVFRLLEQGINPDLEVTRFLTDRAFPNVPAVAGWIAYRAAGREPGAMAILSEFVPNQGDLWTYALDQVDDYLERAAASEERPMPVDTSVRGLLGAAGLDAPARARTMIGTFLDTAWLLGRRTGELHRALAADPDEPAFAPEPFSPMDQRSLYQSLRNGARQSFLALGRLATRLPEGVREDVGRIVESEAAVEARYRALLEARLSAKRIRIHGDYHAGQVLWTGRDVIIIDFEGEPARPLSERRRKRSALVDVAGMIRSFHYAAHGSLVEATGAGGARSGDPALLGPWLAFWYVHVSAAFLRGYREAAQSGVFLPADDEEFARLLDAFLLDKAIYELGYELNNRPDWISIPVMGIRELLGA